MKIKRLVSMMMVTAMVLVITNVAGCSKSSKDTSSNSAGNEELLTIDIYDAAANYQGVQSGWFAKVVKDRFNMELNIIAPQVAGEAVYQTRAATGNLGDIVLLDAGDFMECVQNGLVKDISKDIFNYDNLNDYKNQIETYNKNLPDNKDGKIYGIPTQMTNTSPTSYSQADYPSKHYHS